MACFGVAEQTGRLFARLASGSSSASILVVSDSTAAGTGRWPDLLACWLAQRYPEHDVRFVTWNYHSETYDSPLQRHPGTGHSGAARPSLTVHNLSVGGKSTDYALGCIERGVLEVAPDLILVAHGLNEASRTDPPPDPDQYRAQYLALTETLAASAPQAGMVLVLQNPETTSTVMSERNAEYVRVARLRRCGLIDVHGAFLARPDWQTELMRDGRHPNDAGQQMWAQKVEQALTSTSQVGTPGRRRSSLLPTRGHQLLAKAHVRAWDGQLPAGWSLVNAELCSARRLRAVDGDQPSYLEARIAGERLARIQGRPLTVAARVFVPVADEGNTAGLLEIDDHRQDLDPPPETSPPAAPHVQRSRVATLRAGTFVWVCSTRLIHPRSPSVAVRVYASTGAAGSGEVTIDRISAVPGMVPRDVVDGVERS